MGNYCKRISSNPNCLEMGLCCYKCNKQCDDRCLELAIDNIDSIKDCSYNSDTDILLNDETAIRLKKHRENKANKI